VGRAAVLLAGFWLGLLVASWVMATVTLRMPDRVLGSQIRPESGIEFLPRPLPGELAHRFSMLHAAYVVADLAKMGALAVAALVLVRRP